MPSWLGPIVLAYASGILIASIPGVPLNHELSKKVSEVAIMLAIPLLLFSTDIKAWLRQAPVVVKSFLLCVIAAAVCTAGIAWFWRGSNWDQLPHAAGMIAGVNTGGTPNMQAIGIALGASDLLFIQLNAADILFGGLYLLFLTSIGPRVIGSFLPKGAEAESEFIEHSGFTESFTWQQGLIQLALAVLTTAVSVGLVLLILGDLSAVAIIILSITTLSVIFSFNTKIRTLPGGVAMGNYLLLVFSMAIGLRSTAEQILSNSDRILWFYGSIYIATVILQYLLARWFRVDRDTAMIASTATIFGPAFVGHVAAVLNNRTIIFSGMISGLIGYAVGNYLGIGLAYWIASWGG